MTQCESLHGTDHVATPSGSAMASPWIIGRESELSEVSELITDGRTRLVTLTGVGGVGKSLLARAAVERVDPGFERTITVDLAGARTEEELAVCLASALDVPRDAHSQTWVEETACHLGDRELVLVLDNADRVAVPLRAAASALLARCGGLRLVVTSRTRQHLQEERAVHVLPLVVPDATDDLDCDTLTDVPSVRLFLTRARAARPGFEPALDVVAELCRMVDGLPLALEIVAARVRLFEPELLRTHLRSSLDMLCGRAGDTRSRYACLRQCLAASIGLLDPDEADAFAKLAVFDSDFDLQAAQAVLGIPAARVPTLIEGLVERNLLTAHSPLAPEDSLIAARFSMTRLTRLYALELLEPAEHRALLDEHARHYLELVARCAGEGRDLRPADLEHEQGNLRAGLRHLVLTEQLGRAAELGILLSWYWLTTENPRRSFSYLEELLTDDLPEPFKKRFLACGRDLARLPSITAVEGLDSVVAAEPDEVERAGEAAGTYEAVESARPSAMRPPSESAISCLTRREEEVALLVAQGMTNRSISRTLGIAEWTTVNHVRNIMRKLECSSRVSVASMVSVDAANQRAKLNLDPA